MSYNLGVIALTILNHSPDYFLNCTPLRPITITNSSPAHAADIKDILIILFVLLEPSRIEVDARLKDEHTSLASFQDHMAVAVVRSQISVTQNSSREL